VEPLVKKMAGIVDLKLVSRLQMNAPYRVPSGRVAAWLEVRREAIWDCGGG